MIGVKHELMNYSYFANNTVLVPNLVWYLTVACPHHVFIVIQLLSVCDALSRLSNGMVTIFVYI